MLKEFVEQFKLYKELFAIVAALVGSALFVMTYFATKDALEGTHKKLDALITQRECELSNRITIAEASVVISHLEKEKLEKTLERKELIANVIPKAPIAIQTILKQQVIGLDSKLNEFAGDIATEKKSIAQARQALDKRECAGNVTAR